MDRVNKSQLKDITFTVKEIFLIFVSVMVVTFFIFGLGVWIGKEYAQVKYERDLNEKNQ